MRIEPESYTQPQVARGLEGITAAATEIAEVDGARGKRMGYSRRRIAARTIRACS